MAQILYALIITIAVLLMLCNKEKLLYYFIFLYPILPEYCAVSFSSRLPLFTASRMMLIVLFFALILKNHGKIRFTPFKDRYFGKAFLFFILCETMCCIAHIQDMDSVKTYIGIILENVLFYVLILNHVDTKEKFEKSINVLVIASGIVFFMGVLEPITKINIPMTFLDTGARDNMLIVSYERYNSVRASFSFGHPIALGVYCAAMLPLIMHIRNISNKKKKSLSIIYMLGVGCLVMTMSRGIIAVFVLVFILQLVALTKKERNGYLKMTGAIVSMALVIMILMPSLFAVAKDTLLGTLNAFGASFSVSSSGGNENAILSRLSQLTMIPQVLVGKNLLFGGGTGYIAKHSVYVYLTNRSFLARSIDIEYLAVLLNQGIIGLAGNLLIYISLLKMSWDRSRKNKNSYHRTFFMIFLSFVLSYCTVAQLTTGRILWTLISLYMCYSRLDHKNIEQVREG